MPAETPIAERNAAAMPPDTAQGIMRLARHLLEEAATQDAREDCLERFLAASREILPASERARLGSVIAQRTITPDAVYKRDARRRGG